MFLEECKFKMTWRKYQAEVLEELDKHLQDEKINIVAAPGSGKTILGLEMIIRLNNPVLILSPTITIKNQWKERFLEAYVPENMNVDFISEDIYNLDKFNIATYQALHYAFNKKKIKDENELVEEEGTSRIKTEDIEYDLIRELKEKNIKTVVLDEAHHLRAEWWKSLNEVIKKIENVKVISLTATPPYDVDENEWRRYEEVCGPIDAEISVPELVATGDLCPHQDYVIFNMVTKTELDEIKSIRKEIENFLVELKQDDKIISMIKSNRILENWYDYEEKILNDSQFYSSMIIFLNSAGTRIDSGLIKLISNGGFIPKFDKKWAEIFLKNIIFDHKEDFEKYEDLINDLKKRLEVLGCLEKKTVYLEDINAIKKLMASSIAKMDSIEEIAGKEYENLKEDLSMVILADYVRSDFLECDINNINKIGVVPIFRRLLDKNICDNIAILTGKLKVVPKSLVKHIKEQLELENIDSENIFSDLKINSNYVQINGNKKLENEIVKIVTECINQKLINIVVGTVALLGEGWDAPSVNSLILASYVGSFMLSNQMRGRAIRKGKQPNKTANIWHLVSLAKIDNFKTDFSDLDTLKRRFKGFVGIAYYEDVIQDGIERLGLTDTTINKKDYENINKEMYKIASDRQLMSSRWRKILEKFGGTDIKMVNKLNGDFKIDSKVFVTMDFKRMLIILFAVNFALAVVATMLDSGGVFFSNVIILGYYLYRVITHMNPVNYIREIGKTILNSMIKDDKLVTNKNLVSSVIEKLEVEDNVYYKVYLKGATIYENNLFVKSFEEVYSKVVDTRYIICVGNTYFNVPDIFDKDKKEATIFFEEWNSHVCRGELIFTRSKEGRKRLLKARKNSISYNKDFFVKKEVSKWK